MVDDVNVEWCAGAVRADRLVPVAKLLVSVDATFGDEPWWRDVRAGGVEAALVNVSQPWHGHVLATGPGSELVGFGAMSEPVDGSVELSRIMVHPDWRRRGVGVAVIEALKAAAVDAGLLPWVDVLETSDWAIALYERTGFQTVSYQYGRDSGRLARQMRFKSRVF